MCLLFALLKTFNAPEEHRYISEDSADECLSWYGFDLSTSGIQYSTLVRKGLTKRLFGKGTVRTWLKRLGDEKDRSISELTRKGRGGLRNSLPRMLEQEAMPAF